MFGSAKELPPPCFEFYFDSSLDFSENDVTLGEKARWGYVLDCQGRRKNWDHGSCVQLLILLVVLK